MDVQLIIHEHDEISYVAFEGRLDAGGVEQMEQPFTDAVTARGLPAVVDLSGISFMSSLGIGFLFANTKKLKKAGCKLVLLNPKGMVEGVLRTSKMDKVMPIAYELDEALRIILGEEAAVRIIESRQRQTAPPPDAATAAAGETAEVSARLTLSIKNELAALKDLYVKVEAFLAELSTPYRSGYTVNLALEELVVNIIRYAYMDFDEHLIDIDLSLAGDQLVLVIEDDGRPFDPREGQALNPHLEKPDEEPEVGGLGLMLVLEMVDALKYERVGEKNRTEVRILFGEVAEGEVAEAL